MPTKRLKLTKIGVRTLTKAFTAALKGNPVMLHVVMVDRELIIGSNAHIIQCSFICSPESDKPNGPLMSLNQIPEG